ncbi:MAG: helix-turn-helix domain-containing protein [Solirubrobacterales bacterium]
MAGSGDEEKRQDRESHYRCAAMLHPLRQRIARLLAGGAELGAAELAAELDEAPARIARHLRVLVRRGVLQVVPKRRPNPPLYRWSSEAEWAQEMLAEEGE